MANESKPVIRTIKIRLPKWVRCPSCCQRQLFKKEHENWKFVKDININRPKLLSDGLKDHILYLENLPGLYAARAIGNVGRGHVQGFLYTLQELGIKPYAAIFDMAAVYPKQMLEV